jgi:methylenetetrahydrofolate dehydrogenase (NADP+)/methenyltetrahydrofolate cyclohydrolase
MITREHINEGAIVVDVGTNEVDGEMVGDIDFDSIKEIATVTPVIGGVGSITLACLFENTYEIYRKNIQSI